MRMQIKRRGILAALLVALVAGTGVVLVNAYDANVERSAALQVAQGRALAKAKAAAKQAAVVHAVAVATGTILAAASDVVLGASAGKVDETVRAQMADAVTLLRRAVSSGPDKEIAAATTEVNRTSKTVTDAVVAWDAEQVRIAAEAEAARVAAADEAARGAAAKFQTTARAPAKSSTAAGSTAPKPAGTATTTDNAQTAGNYVSVTTTSCEQLGEFSWQIGYSINYTWGSVAKSGRTSGAGASEVQRFALGDGTVITTWDIACW